jgi:hypothetical protein
MCTRILHFMFPVYGEKFAEVARTRNNAGQACFSARGSQETSCKKGNIVCALISKYIQRSVLPPNIINCK